LGIAIAMGGAGGLLGALLVERLNRRFALGMVLIGASAVGMGAGLLTVLAGGPVYVAAAMLMLSQLVSDGAASIYTINQLSVRQTVTPDRLLGRVNASSDMLPMAVAPLGALAGGVLGGLIGVRNTLWIAELSSLVTLAWLALSPVRRLQELPPPADATELALAEP
jgi:predicted MFS family arabinose efflux permease